MSYTESRRIIEVGSHVIELCDQATMGAFFYKNAAELIGLLV